MVEVLWKMVSGIINRRVGTEVRFHGVLHGLRAGRGTRPNSLKAKLTQKLMAMREDVIYEIFLYPRKLAISSTESAVW